MLKGINPRITPEMLYVMAQMGHGDDLAIVDANFPAYALARHLPHDRVLHFAGRLPGAVQTVLTLLPLDRFVPAAATTMQVVGDPEAVPAPVAEIIPDLARELGVPPWKVRTVRDQSRAWTPEGIAAAVRAVATADADIKGRAHDASYTLERLVLTVAGLREAR